MPGISDPGERLVRAAVEAGHAVEVVPGPSAAITALVASGLPTGRYAFEGFLPRKGSGRTARLAEIAAERRTTVLYEAPHRLARTLADLAAACGGDRRVAIGRELTKLHEEMWRGIARGGPVPGSRSGSRGASSWWCSTVRPAPDAAGRRRGGGRRAGAPGGGRLAPRRGRGGGAARSACRSGRPTTWPSASAASRRVVVVVVVAAAAWISSSMRSSSARASRSAPGELRWIAVLLAEVDEVAVAVRQALDVAAVVVAEDRDGVEVGHPRAASRPRRGRCRSSPAARPSNPASRIGGSPIQNTIRSSARRRSITAPTRRAYSARHPASLGPG